MAEIEINVLYSLEQEIRTSDTKTKKLFEKQKTFMGANPHHPSLGRTKLVNVCDKYGNHLWEVRMDGKRRIVFVERGTSTIIWLKICSHDEIRRNSVIRVKDDYEN